MHILCVFVYLFIKYNNKQVKHWFSNFAIGFTTIYFL